PVGLASLLISQSDCYVTLWLPTASSQKMQTKTVQNNRNPIWNETFCYRIDSRVKNMLELKIWDEDRFSKDDELCTVLFDIARLQIGRKVRVKFFLDCPENIITNGVNNMCVHTFFVVMSWQSKTTTFVVICICRPKDMDVRFGFDLCTEEQDFLCKRKKYVAAALKKVLQLEEDLQDHEVPVVAITTTGGGMRSLTAMYGSLLGLQKLNILDSVSYITGLSGTTWTMANLYEDANWSQKYLEEAINKVRKQVTKCKIKGFTLDRLKYYYSELKERTQQGHNTSFIDLWGLMVEYLLHDEKDNHKLSDQRQAMNEGQNPLPIYLAINLKKSYSAQDFREWLEFTPYEVGFWKYGAFIRSEDFGSEFFMGRLMKKLPETRICYLEGDSYPVLPMNPYEAETRLLTPSGPLSTAFRNVLTGRPTIAEFPNFLRGFQMHNEYLESKQFSPWKDTVLDTFANKLMETAEDPLSLTDTGFFINTSYPPLLIPQRKVDVILHLNYSGGSQTLVRGVKLSFYFSEQGIPFPRIDISKEDRKNLKECYVFEDAHDTRVPTVLFFPLVNDTFKKYKAPGVERRPSEMEEGKVDVSSPLSPYTTRELSFSEANFDNLVKMTDYNILNNENLIVQALRTAVERKKQQTK
uniref:Phospholipase A2 n=1 Tax=Pelusios castaneus TaxID=367368 RepID=A0A8C8SXP1_9SAUR